MKKLLFALPILFALSCGNTEEKTAVKETAPKDAHAGHNHKEGDGHNHDGHDHAGHDHSAKKEGPVSIKTHDPICKMERDEKWAFESVYQGDTVKFCSPVCKQKFDKDPASFVAVK